MKKINVLEIIGSMNMGGAETFLMNVYRNIDREKYQFYFLCYGHQKFDYEDEIYRLGGKVIKIDRINKRNFLTYYSQIKEIIKRNNISVVHSHTYYNSMFGILAAKKCKVRKIITHSHNTISETNPSFIKKVYFKLSKFIINKYSTNYLACGIAAGRALFGDKIEFDVVDNGINLENFFFDKKVRTEKRKELCVDDNCLLIGHVGRFDEQKNHVFLVDIFSEIKRKRKDSKLLLVGDGDLKDIIIKEAKKEGVFDEIIFLGKRTDVNELYNAMDLIIFPSLYEGLPITLIEAQANGLPIIASNTIDKDVNISGKIVFNSLNNDSNNWSKLALDKKNVCRYNCNEYMLNSVYNMKENVSKIADIYSN